MNDLQRAAARARPALAVLTAELGEPSPDAARALVVLGQMLDDIEAGRHPLDRPDDWPQRDRWPDRPHWDRWRWAIKTLAVASGTTAHCSPKYHHMRVDTRQARSDALTEALLDVADVIELASDRERDAMTVADLIEQLRELPPDLPVMLPCEAGIDYARAVRVADVARHHRDWTWTPVGQYRETPHEDTVGPPIRAAIIDLEPTGTIDGLIGLFAGRATPALTIDDMNEIAAAGWAGELESVRLSGDPLGSLAGIDEIINRGDREAFTGLLHAIIEQPGGPVADRVRTLYERAHHRAGDPEFVAWPQYQAAHWLTLAMGQFRPAEPKSQRFANVWDAIEDGPAEAEKMKRLSALRAAVPVHERDGRPL